MSGTHTPEPWRYEVRADGLTRVVRWRDMGIEPQQICLVVTADATDAYDSDASIANAARIVACVNYCRGLPTAALEGEAKSAIDLLRECLPIVNEYRAWKQADLSGLVDRIDAALAALAPHR